MSVTTESRRFYFMAKDKKSFILYLDQKGIFDKLSDEQAGKLIKHIFSYVSDENPEADFITELAFESIKTQLKRDLKKFEDVKSKRSEAGKRSAESRKKNAVQQSSTKLSDVQQNTTKLSDDTFCATLSTVNDNDNVINNKLFISKITKDHSYLEITAMQTKTNVETVLKYLDEFDKHLIRTSEQKKHLKDFKTHFTNWLNKQDIKKVIKRKKVDYGNPNQ